MRLSLVLAISGMMLLAPRVMASKLEANPSAQPAKKAQPGKKSTVPSSKTQPSSVSDQNPPPGWRNYSDGMSNLSITYPDSWAIEPSPSLDIPFRISGTTAAGFKAEMAVQRASALLPMPEVVDYARKHIWSKDSRLRQVAEGTDSWGVGKLFGGPWREITFQQGDLEVRQRWYFFRNGQQNNMVSFTAPDKDWKNAWSTFDTMLASLQENNRGKMIKMTPEQEREALRKRQL